MKASLVPDDHLPGGGDGHVLQCHHHQYEHQPGRWSEVEGYREYSSFQMQNTFRSKVLTNLCLYYIEYGLF